MVLAVPGEFVDRFRPFYSVALRNLVQQLRAVCRKLRAANGQPQLSSAAELALLDKVLEPWPDP